MQARERITVREATAVEAGMLELPDSASVLVIRRVVWTADGRPVETNEMIADAKAYELSYEFDL